MKKVNWQAVASHRCCDRLKSLPTIASYTPQAPIIPSKITGIRKRLQSTISGNTSCYIERTRNKHSANNSAVLIPFFPLDSILTLVNCPPKTNQNRE